jgi:allantoinase
VLLNSDVCNFYPEIIEEGNKRHWVWLAHGKNNSTMEAGMEEEAERKYLTDVVGTITERTGQAPKGWLGPGLTETFNTPNILADLGLTYLLDWCNDDQPYPMKIKNGKKMISVPYSIELNDLSLFLGKNLSGDDFYRLACDQFDVLYEEGAQSARVMALALHPFVISQPFRQKYLNKILEYIAGHPHVWLTTSDEIAEWYYAEGYEQMATHRA